MLFLHSQNPLSLAFWFHFVLLLFTLFHISLQFCLIIGRAEMVQVHYSATIVL